MSRRALCVDDRIFAIDYALYRRWPRGIRLHRFGLKSDGAECVAFLDGSVASVDSHVDGCRARAISNERRKDDPAFSKSNVFVAEVMEKWYRGQVASMANPKTRPNKNSLDFGTPHDGNASPYHCPHS